MTTIVAVKTKKGKIRFAWDSQTTWGGRGISGSEKVFANGPVIFGVSGAVRTSNILKYMEIPTRDKKESDTPKWIVTRLIPAIIKELKAVDAGLMEDAQINTESHIIVAVGDQIGYLSGDLAFVQDEADIYAVGSGSSYALGALAAGVDPADSIRVAGYFDIYTNADAAVASAKSLLAGVK